MYKIIHVCRDLNLALALNNTVHASMYICSYTYVIVTYQFVHSVLDIKSNWCLSKQFGTTSEHNINYVVSDSCRHQSIKHSLLISLYIISFQQYRISGNILKNLILSYIVIFYGILALLLTAY